MTEFQFVRLAANGQAQQLVAQANAEHRLAADQLANVGHLGDQRFGIAGAVRQENAVGRQAEHVFGGSERRNHRDAAASVHQAAQNIVLDTEIVCHHVVADLRLPAHPLRWRARFHRCGPFVWFARAHPAGQIEPGHGRDGAGFLHQALRVRFHRRENPAHHATAAQMAHQRARIQIGNDGHAARVQKLAGHRIGAPVARHGRELAHH